MEKYCKAYPVERFHEFAGWGKKNGSQGDEKRTGGKESSNDDEPPATKYLYLHKDYTVTDGIFTGEKVVFDDLTPEWVDFCKNVLKFEVPIYESVPSAEPKAPVDEAQ